MIQPLTDDECAALLTRFQGEPGATPGLSENELIAMLAHVTKQGKLEETGLNHWVDAYREGGLLPDDFPA
jgi:hypothetical protein